MISFSQQKLILYTNMNPEQFVPSVEKNERPGKSQLKVKEVKAEGTETVAIDFSRFKTWRGLFDKLQEVNAPGRLLDEIGSVRVEARKLPRFDRNAIAILAFGIPETGNLRAAVIDLVELEETRRRFQQQEVKNASGAEKNTPKEQHITHSPSAWQHIRNMFR